jgi:hypothetical protein
MTAVTPLAASDLSRAKPGFAGGWRRLRQDAPLAALGRTEYCPVRRSLASFASGARGT